MWLYLVSHWTWYWGSSSFCATFGALLYTVLKLGRSLQQIRYSC